MPCGLPRLLGTCSISVARVARIVTRHNPLRGSVGFQPYYAAARVSRGNHTVPTFVPARGLGAPPS